MSSEVADDVRVSVLTPVLNEEDGLQAVLEEMRAQADPGGAIEFLFIDGRSTDRTRELLEAAAREDPRIRVLDNPKRLTNPALNIGLAAARGEFTARMDAHTHYPVTYLRTGVERLCRGDVVSASGPQIAAGDNPWSRRVALALSTRLGIGGAAFRRPLQQEIEVPSGFTGVWRTATLTDAGGWDEEVHPNGDAELAARLRAAGGRIVCVPDMAAHYVPRRTLGALRGQYWRYGQGRARTVLRHRDALQPAHLLPPAVVLAGVGAVVAPVRSLRRLARIGLGAYALATVATAAGEAREHGSEAAYLPAVFATMHLSWGAGFLLGLYRYGLRGETHGTAIDRV